MTQEPITQTPVTAAQPNRNNVSSIIGLVIGLPLGWYAGATLLIPLALSVLVAAIVSRALPSRKAFLVAASLVGGHVAWMILGTVLIQRWVVLGDIVFLGAGLIWLLWRPGLGATIFLGICHVLEAVYTGYLLSVTATNGLEFKAHVVHFVLYGASLVSLITGYLAHRKTGAPVLPVTSP
mgnify:CR=1 FL=1